KNRSVDDFFYGGKSASYGGVTTIVDFLDPARNAQELEKLYYERMSVAKKCPIDYHLHAAIKNPDGNLEEFVRKMQSLGMSTLKLFTTYSDTGRRTYDKDIIELLKLSEKYHFMILSHTENDDLIVTNDTFKYRDITISRPSDAETSEALKLASYVRKYGGHLYMVHVSTGNTLEALKKDYGDILNKKFFLESCPQYFLLDRSSLDRADGYLYTFAPPLRSLKEQRLMIDNFNLIHTIGTDHCAFNRADKQKELLKGMPLGIGGIESSFQTLNRLFGDQIIDKMTINVASTDGLQGKGALKEGNDADLFLYKRNSGARVIKPHGISDYSVYEGYPASGEVISTMVRGHFVLKDKVFIAGEGKLVAQKEKLW
ncbi:MAG: amidohydrolase family protein, partial [Bacilli bacterium]